MIERIVVEALGLACGRVNCPREAERHVVRVDSSQRHSIGRFCVAHAEEIAIEMRQRLRDKGPRKRA